MTPVWFAVLGIGWAVVRRRPHHLEPYEEFRRSLGSTHDSEAAQSR
ncbi:hypothetical protein ACXR8F_03620 [Terrabacter sp. AAH1]